ncbi:MAG: hypothetical protein IJL38_02385 [Bacteroidales bacterium]|nr:hypothetical protein [Bacteroidales bacterium]
MMRKKYILFFLVCCCMHCFEANAQIEEAPSATCRRYRHIILHETDKFNVPKISDTDSFAYFYRPEFKCRYLDDDYILCQIETINDTLNICDLPFNVCIGMNTSVKVLDLQIRILEWYRSKESPLIEMFFSDIFFSDEFIYGKKHGLKDHISYIDSCINDTTERFAQLFLLVKEDEIPLLKKYYENNCKIMFSCSRMIGKKSFYADMFFIKYETDELYNLNEWGKFLHHKMKELGTLHKTDTEKK